MKVVEEAVLRDRDFTEVEASTILAAARRWVPWLCAYSGARVGEITQLRRKDVRHEGGVPVFRIPPRPAR